jgi:hypothetical protein
LCFEHSYFGICNFSLVIKYAGFEAGLYDLSCTGIYKDEYDQRLLLEKLNYQEEFYYEYYLTWLDILHSLRSNDSDDMIMKCTIGKGTICIHNLFD